MKTAVGVAIGVGAFCGALALAIPADANIVLVGGDPGLTSTGKGNDPIKPLYGQSPIAGAFFGHLSQSRGFVYGALKVDVASTISFADLGSEASYSNQFQINDGANWQTLKTTSSAYGRNADVAGVVGPITGFPAGPLVASPPQIGASYLLGAGDVIPFRFLINGGNGVAANNGQKKDFCKFCSMFVTFLDDANKPLPQSGQAGGSASTVDVFVNDGGIDDDHDDMMIRIFSTPVSVPAALPIIAAAFAGFGFAGWRSRLP